MAELLTPDLCVIGAGSGGLSVAAAATQMGVDVVLIEKGRMGGDCLNTGCVPSKPSAAKAISSSPVISAPSSASSPAHLPTPLSGRDLTVSLMRKNRH